MERKEKSSEMLSGSDSQEHLPENTKEEGVRMFKANPDFLLRMWQEKPYWCLSAKRGYLRTA